VTRRATGLALLLVLAGCGQGQGGTVRTGGGNLMGSWVMGTEDDGMDLQFVAGRKLMLRTTGELVPSNGYYVLDGDRITVVIPGMDSTTLTRSGPKGEVLEGRLLNRPVRLVRQ